MAKMGIPTLKLKSGYGKGKRAGNASAVVKEALEERFSSDPDLDRSRTKYNLYLRDGFRSGAKLAEYWQREADAFRTVDKNGKEKRLRSDASIGCALIVKPDKEYLDTLSPQDQIQLVKDAMSIVSTECRKRGIQIDAGVLHVDESAPHGHIFGHDPEYKLGKKLNLAFFSTLNKRVPELMRQRGWDIQDLTVYDVEAVDQMTDAEKAAYKEERRADREEHGVDSLTYKQRKRQKEQDDRQREQDAREEALRRKEAEIAAREEKSRTEALRASQEAKRIIDEADEFATAMMEDARTKYHNDQVFTSDVAVREIREHAEQRAREEQERKAAVEERRKKYADKIAAATPIDTKPKKRTVFDWSLDDD